MNIEEARLYLEHTSKDDFNLEEWQKENRYQAIQVVLKEIERLNNIINEIDTLLDKAENGWVEHLNGTVIGYQYPRECCKLRIKYIREKIKELKGVNKNEQNK